LEPYFAEPDPAVVQFPQHAPMRDPLCAAFSPVPHEAAACRVAILGFGTVGSSVARLITENAASPVRLTHVFNRNVARKRADWVSKDTRWTECFDDVLDSDAEVVVELVGDVTASREFVRRALEAGKHVVTANKQLIAHEASELLALARRHGRRLGFGAAVAGGVPVIAGILEGLAADRLEKVTGILNGTCNYILSRMERDHVPMAEAVREAQKLGYAEADPSADVDGLDARAKIAILAGVALGVSVNPEHIVCRSITPLAPLDFEYARELHCTIRQLSVAELKDGHVIAHVQPALVPLESPLARVNANENMVVATGRYGGNTVFAGPGAGGAPTAVAVLSDVMAIARGHAPAPDHAMVSLPVTSVSRQRNYLRFVVDDRPGILATLANALAREGIDIDAVLQHPGHPKSRLPFVITTEACEADALARAAGHFSQCDFHVEPPLCVAMVE